MSDPFFSIVVTCHNQFDFIGDAVQSALSQTYSDREVIVVDDASTDSSLELLGAFGDQIELVPLEKNLGRSGARNAGAAVARGDYLVFLDGDDALKPWALTIYERLVRAYQPALILGRLTWFEGQLPQLDPNQIPAAINVVKYDNLAEKDRPFRSSASAIVVARSAFESVEGWSRQAEPFEDQFLEVKLAHSGRAVQILEPATIHYRLHQSNTIHDVRRIIAGCYGFVAAYTAAQKVPGIRRTFAQDALMGGPALWAVKKAFRAKLYLDGFKLFTRIWPLVSVSALHRLRAILFGRKPTEIIPSNRESALQAKSAVA